MSEVASRSTLAATELHRALLDNMTEGVSLATEDGILVYTNPAEDQMFGYEPGELIGQHVSVQNAYPAEENERRVQEVIQHLQRHGFWEGEWRNRRKDGSEFVTSSRITGVDVGGAPHWLCVQRDVSSSKSAEQALLETERRFRLMADSAPILMWVNGPDGGCEFVNQEYLTFFGKSLEEVVGFGWLPAAHPDDGERYISAYLSAVEKRSRFDAAARFQTGDGTFRWLRSVAEARVAEDGSYLGHVGISSDITEEREAQIRQAILVEELNHRVKNTLAVVQSIAHQSLKQIPDTGEVVRKFEGRLAALASAHRLLTERSWQHAAMDEVISAAVTPFDPRRFVVEGDECTLHPQTAVNLSLAINELATNAAKYGALSVEGGQVWISWNCAGDRVQFQWREAGGPMVQPPQKRGFGTRMIERVLAAELKGVANIRFDPEGLVCTIEADA